MRKLSNRTLGILTLISFTLFIVPVAVVIVRGGMSFFDDTDSVANLKILGVALKQYEQDHDGKLPPLSNPATFKAALCSYVPKQKDGRDVFVDPVGPQPYCTGEGLSYKVAAKLPARTIVLVEGRFKVAMALFADGRVDDSSKGVWRQPKPKSLVPVPAAGHTPKSRPSTGSIGSRSFR